MEDKWPFMLITFGLLFALGFTIANLERTTVMNQWTDRRCELPIMAAAAFFKPESDPRTSSAFAADNFEFCLQTTVEKFITMFMAPINALFGKQAGLTGDAMNMIGTIRNLAQNMYKAFLSYLDVYFKKFNRSVFEMSRIAQHIRMAMDRANAVAVSMIYMGATIFRGIINSIQFMIKVILIICGIMLAIIIILFFVLFPIMPLILATLAAIISAVMVFAGILSSSISADADDKMGGLCFAEGTMVQTIDEKGTIHSTPVEKIRNGDRLADGCGSITAIIRMKGDDIVLRNLHGIYVSGSHVVRGTDEQWKLVADDERSIPTDHRSPIIYCFNTTSNNLPIQSLDGSTILFRDWEELSYDDPKGQYMWNYLVSKMLHSNESSKKYTEWKHNIRSHCEDALMGRNVLVKTGKGWVPISEIEFGQVVDRNGKEQDVLGCIKEHVSHAEDKDGTWYTERYEEDQGIWKKSKNTVPAGSDTIDGFALITESGEYIIWDEKEKKEKIIRDFTEVGHQEIHKTYAFLEARLRMTEQI
jgi:hypothetical protein